jgi:hypothetical protein
MCKSSAPDIHLHASVIQATSINIPPKFLRLHYVSLLRGTIKIPQLIPNCHYRY